MLRPKFFCVELAARMVRAASSGDDRCTFSLSFRCVAGALPKQAWLHSIRAQHVAQPPTHECTICGSACQYGHHVQ